MPADNERLPIHEASDYPGGDRSLDADVVIVGSGAGGSVAAYELARTGKTVVVLEAGPYVPSTEFNERHVDMIERLYQDAAGQMNTDGDLTVLQGRCLGGSTVVNAAVAFRTPDHILAEWRESFGLTDLTNERLDPLFEKVERNVAVHETGPHEINTNSRILEQGCERLGWSHRPLKRNIRDCALTGYCLAGCATDRKQSMLVTYIPWAVHFGAEFYTDTEVDRVLTEGGRAVGVEATVREQGSGRALGKLTVRAKVVIVAAGAIQSPLLLLRSGIPNENGLIGKNFACHPSLMLFGEMPQPVYGWTGATLGSYCDEFAAPDKGGYIYEFGTPAPDFTGGFPFGIGPEYMELMTRYKNMVTVASLIHDRNDGQVGYGEDGKKQIIYQLSEGDRANMRACFQRAAEMIFAAGATRVHLPTLTPTAIESVEDAERVIGALSLDPGTLLLTTYHPQGTLRMGNDPSASVVGPLGEVHAVPGLFVTDASLFPTSIMVNPQITVYTLSTYISERLLEHADAYFG